MPFSSRHLLDPNKTLCAHHSLRTAEMVLPKKMENNFDLFSSMKTTCDCRTGSRSTVLPASPADNAHHNARRS